MKATNWLSSFTRHTRSVNRVYRKVSKISINGWSNTLKIEGERLNNDDYIEIKDFTFADAVRLNDELQTYFELRRKGEFKEENKTNG
jgi:hypothetical protein